MKHLLKILVLLELIWSNVYIPNQINDSFCTHVKIFWNTRGIEEICTHVKIFWNIRGIEEMFYKLTNLVKNNILLLCFICYLRFFPSYGIIFTPVNIVCSILFCPFRIHWLFNEGWLLSFYVAHVSQSLIDLTHVMLHWHVETWLVCNWKNKSLF